MLDAIFRSSLVLVVLTLLAYCFYAVIIGISLFPSALLIAFVWKSIPLHGNFTSLLLVCLSCGAGLFLYFLTGTYVMGSLIRILSWGIKPGRYRTESLTMIRWLLYNGLYHLAGTTILSFVPMGFLTTTFFRIIGAKIGKNAGINTWVLNDAYLLEIGDNVVIGGKTDISCHTFEKGYLILQPVKIGDNTLIGQGCYISPGVTIGRDCVIGQFSLIRKGKTIPDKTVLTAIAGMPVREVARIEKNFTF